jgi:DNA anti-recombination protein RmuC
MATQSVVHHPHFHCTLTSDQTVALALNDALIAIRAAQQELSQSHEKLRLAFDRLVEENIELRKKIEVLGGMFETQNQVFNEKLQALSGQVDAVQKLTLDQAKERAEQLIKDSEGKTDRKIEQFRSDVKAAHNDHIHIHYCNQGVREPTTHGPNKKL